MKRTKIKDRKLPDYTKGEEIFNMVSHIVGGGIGVIATVLCVVFAAMHKNVYGISIYHGLRPNTAKKVLQVIDHCSIYLLIAGTYTPFCLCSLRTYNPALGWTVFGIIWGLAALGVILNAIDLRKFRTVSMVLYIGMGWCVIFTVRIIIEVLGTVGFSLLLAGGVSYTVGAIFYGIGAKRRYIHSVFHLFVVLGSILHFLCILLFVM